MSKSRKIFSVLLLATTGLSFANAGTPAKSELPISGNASETPTTIAFGTIRGFIRDETGAPIAGALIALFRDGMATVRQVRSNIDGSFAARVAPGRYSLTAMAEGFSVVSLANVDVDRAEDIAFRFNLVRTGSGNTLPERRADRNQAKWRNRSNQSRRIIYQNTGGTGETTATVEKIENDEDVFNESDSVNPSKRGQSLIETYAASGAPNNSNYIGLNFATIQPMNEHFDLIIAGQTGIGANAPNRLETTARIKLNEVHRLNLSVGGAQLGKITFPGKTSSEQQQQQQLGQFSFQVFDEWRLRNNVIVVIGMDYAQFVGASKSFSIAPRLGLQFETNAKTRFNVAYTTQNESRNWSEAADLEDGRVLFRVPESDGYAVADKRILMPKMRRLEFGVERVLDNASSVETTIFFDATNNRGVSFINLPPVNTSGFGESAEASGEFANVVQNGLAQGLRIVYSRRLDKIFSASAGYALGRGQSISNSGLTNPANLFEDDFFQTVTAQLAADFNFGTQIRTVWRYSPRDAIFAIDPFAGRVDYGEPSFSVLVTQKLPTWGLPSTLR